MKIKIGSSLTGFLAVILITFKLAGVITWPWVAVLAPLWVGLVIFAVVLMAIVGVAFFAAYFAARS